MNLPIDIIPNTLPQRFKWCRSVTTPIGEKSIECEGSMPASSEVAISLLISLAKQQEVEILALKKQVEELKKPVNHPQGQKITPQKGKV